MFSSENPKNLNKLLEEIEKSEFEVKTLGEIIHTFRSGEGTVTRALKNNGNYPCITAPDVFESSIYVDEYKTFTDLGTVKNKTLAEKGDILAVVDGYSHKKNKEGFSICLDNNNPLVGNTIYLLKHSQIGKYLVFVLSTDSVKKQLSILFTTARLSSMLRISLKDLKKIKIPLPLLDLQTQIGDFLFTFIEYDKQLKREQKTRSKQFHHFKEQIFTELIERCGLRDADWEIKRIKDFATEIYSGNGVTRDQLGTGDFPAIKCGDLNTQLSLQLKDCISLVDLSLLKKPKFFEKGDILISKMSNKTSNIGSTTVYLGEERGVLGSDVDAIRHLQNPKYLSYALSTRFVRDQIENMAQNSTVFHLYTKDIKQIQIPLPPLEEQERIVEILDKFYDLSENPDKGLNNLIKLNQKQYEYYRDLIFRLLEGG